MLFDGGGKARRGRMVGLVEQMLKLHKQLPAPITEPS
jgi:hypothetical protein